MVANPMQRKTRNSFLLGMIITLLVCLIIGGVIYFMVIVPQNDKKEEERGEEILAYVLNQDVKSGQVITTNMLTKITVYSNMIPSDYVNDNLIKSMQLQDTNGNVLYTNSEGIQYINVKDNKKYISVSNKDKEQVKIGKDEAGYYKTTESGEKEYIEFLTVPTVAKIDMNKNSILTTSSITKSDEITTNDLRYVEYNMISLPTTLIEGEFVDIRLKLPNGQDLIVVSKKEIKTILGSTIGLELSEQEILMMESAIVEAYVMTASKFYVTQYVEPGNQQAATNTYVPTQAVQALISADSNIVETARKSLEETFDENRRSWIESERSNYIDEATENIEEKLKDEIENAKAAREAYLSGLTSY